MPKLLDAIADHYLTPDGAARRRPTRGREAVAQGRGIDTDAEVRKEHPRPPRLSLRTTLRALGLI